MNIKVQKRNGDIVNFDFNKITIAIQKAAKAVCEEISKENMSFINIFINNEIHEFLENFSLCNNNEFCIGIEDIQNIVEKNLTRYASFNIAKAYIVYREQRRINRENLNTTISVAESVDEYLNQTDWRTKENANSGYSVGGLQYNISSKVIANYWLKKIYPTEVSQSHINGDIHIHDLGFLGPYCQGHSLRQLISEGFGGVEGETSSGPAKHLYTLVNQIVNFVYTLQNEFAGAQAFSSVDTLLAPFVYYDGLNYKQTKQCIQSLIYGLNIPSRSCHQKPFVNFTFDTVCPEDLKDQAVIVSGKPSEDGRKYSDFKKEMDWINQAFIEIMTCGDIHGRGFSFPIPTYNITKDFNWDSEISNMIFEMTGKYGTPTFQNFINSDLNPKDVRSMCCRISLDKTQITKRGGGLFGSNDSVGSLGVCTINLPRMAYLSDKNDSINSFYCRLDYMLNVCKTSLEIKRKTINMLTDGGLYPYSKRYISSWKNHFSTIGVIGMHEACLNLFGKGISNNECKDFAEGVLNFCNKKLIEYQNETGNLYNLEASPAEGASYRLAKIDKKEFVSCKHSGDDNTPYYTNSTMLPVGYTDDVFSALEHQESLQKLYSGGTIFHMFLGEKISSDVCKALLKTACTNYKIPFYSITPTYSICETHGYLSGCIEFCPQCNCVTQIYSRVVGYYQPIARWNIGKKAEFRDRETYKKITKDDI